MRGVIFALLLSLVATVAAVPAYADNSDQYYHSTDGSEVHRPTHQPSKGYGRETAICEDGTHSYSHHHRGTCSHHGGVEEWED
jgi:hypothetical protein